MKPAVVIVGLGNPGAGYERTRHNAGFRAVDALAQACDAEAWQPRDKFLAECCEGLVGDRPVLFVKPRTYMNLSGDCVRRIRDFYKLEPAAFLVLTDEVDLPLGTLRLRKEGSPGTHNGLRSVADTLGDAYARLRIGVGPKPSHGIDLAAWVLSVPPPEDEERLAAVWERVPEVVRAFVLDGVTVER